MGIDMKNIEKELFCKAKLMLFFSKWSMPMIKWYIEVEHGETFHDIIEDCESWVSRYRRDCNLPLLYANFSENHIPLLSKFTKGKTFDEIKKEYESRDEDPTRFLPWIEESLKESCKGLYDLYLMGCMGEWEKYLFYYRPKIKDITTIDEIIKYLQYLTRVGEDITEEDMQNISLMRNDVQLRQDLINTNPGLPLFELYSQIIQGNSLHTLFCMLNCEIKPEDGDKRNMKKSLKLMIEHSKLSDYFQQEYDAFRKINPSFKDIPFSKSKKVEDVIKRYFESIPEDFFSISRKDVINVIKTEYKRNMEFAGIFSKSRKNAQFGPVHITLQNIIGALIYLKIIKGGDTEIARCICNSSFLSIGIKKEDRKKKEENVRKNIGSCKESTINAHKAKMNGEIVADNKKSNQEVLFECIKKIFS